MIYAGTHRDNIWLDRFSGLGLDAGNIAIIDRYCLSNFAKLDFKGKACGLTFSLNKLAKLPRKKGHALNIFSSDVDINYGATVDHFQRSFVVKIRISSRNHSTPSCNS